MAGPRRRARHHRADSAFRPSAADGPAGPAPSRTQALALLCGLVLIAAGVAAVSYLVKPAKARAFTLFYGSVYINDDRSPVAIDLASGKPTVRLVNPGAAVSQPDANNVDTYPLAGGNTLLLAPSTGEFNMVDSTGFVIKSSDGGVPLPKTAGTTTSMAVPSGSSAYIVRSSGNATSVFLVGASTVSSAVGSQSGTKARAYATLPAQVPSTPGAAAEADGALWVLTGGPGQTRHITELTVPAGSNAGVTLTATGHGPVTGPAAVGSATTDPLGTGDSGASVIGVASADSVSIFSGATRTNYPVSAGPGVDKILPVTHGANSPQFLYHSSAGWSLVSVPTPAVAVAKVSPLPKIPTDAQLVTPAASNGDIYTMDTASGSLWQIGSKNGVQRVPGAATYPLAPRETPAFGAAQVLSDGNRVIFDSRANLFAEVVFAGDTSRQPRVVNKLAAVTVDPSGATKLADAHAKGQQGKQGKTRKPPKTAKQPTQTINDKIDCTIAKQIPRVPTLVAGDRAARSITLSWIYQKLDPSDCLPSTYVVDIKALTPGSPSPPQGQVPVQGDTAVTLTHLFPDTEYQLTVTAYINSQHTSSAPIDVTTGPEGPAAPTDVRATADSSGNWTVSWNSCGGVAEGCVPSQTWYVIPNFCDGRGLSAAPARITVQGDPTQHSFTHVFAGGTALLGRALCFQVQGVSPQGTIGTTSDPSPPAFSWSAPLAGAMQLHASQPANTDFGGTTTTTVDLDLGADPIRDVGGIGASIELQLTGAGDTQTKTIVWDGRTDRVSTQFGGVKAGAQYSARASIAPPRHAGDAVTVGPVTVTTRASWPQLSANATCPTGGGAVVLSCTLVVNLSGPSSAQAEGELFDLTGDSNLSCGGGNSAKPLGKDGFDPATDAITTPVDLLTYNGQCTVTVQLAEAGRTGGPLVFGGTTSPVISTTVDLGQASTLDASASDFSASFDPNNPTATIHYDGNHDAASQLARNWVEKVHAPDGTLCGDSAAQPDVTVSVSPCNQTQGDQTGWTFDISYQDVRDGTLHSFTNIAIPGKPSGFIPPCNVRGAFTAQWTGSYDAPSVTVNFDNTATDLRGCSGFNYAVFEPLKVKRCASADEGDTPPGSDSLGTLSCQDDFTLPGRWQMEVTYSSARHDAVPIDIDVAGDPPQPPPPPPPSSDPPPSTDPPPTPVPTPT